MSVEGLSPIVPLVYTDISGINQYTNVLLIDNSVPDYQIFVDSANSSTFPVVYSTSSAKSDVLAFLQSYFITIPRIGMCFTSSSGGPKTFLDREPFFVDDETVPYSANLQFILNIITEFQVKNIDYLACDTLGYPNWKNYYDILLNNTGVTVGASSDQTGNIFYGGDWVLESTNEDVEFIYFTQNIEYYTYLLDSSTWANLGTFTTRNYGISNGNDGYLYVVAFDSNRIVKIPLNNPGGFTSWISSGLVAPVSMCIYNNYCYIANNNGFTAGAGGIVRVNMTTAVSNTYATNTQGCNNPRWVVTDGTYLYVSNSSNGPSGSCAISRMILSDPTATTDSPTWVTGLNAAAGIVIGGKYLYVANNGANTISQILLSTGAVVNASWATATQGVSSPQGLIISGGFLYVSNSGNSTISKISINYPTTIFNASWATTTQGLNSPWGIEIVSGYIYAGSNNTAYISQIGEGIEGVSPTIIGGGTISGGGNLIT